jgi:hypothetical protein
LVYQQTGSLFPCMVLHCINNTIAFGVGEKWGWQIPLVLAGSLVLIALIMSGAVRAWEQAR